MRSGSNSATAFKCLGAVRHRAYFKALSLQAVTERIRYQDFVINQEDFRQSNPSHCHSLQEIDHNLINHSGMYKSDYILIKFSL